MDRKSVGAIVAYTALTATLLTPLYDPFATGRDDSWAVAVVLVAAHFGLGAAVGRAWTLAVPLVVVFAWFFAEGAEGLAWIGLFFGAPTFFTATAAGWAAGRWVRHGRSVGAAAAFAVALAPIAWALTQHFGRGPHVPADVQAQLPVDLSLGNLCPGAETPPRLLRELRRSAAALERELRRRPDHLVTYTYYWADQPAERREITVRELAEEQLEDLQTGGRRCAPALQRRLRAAL